MAQAWMNRRFQGLRPRGFGGATHFHSVAGLRAPAGFEDHWSVLEPTNGLRGELLARDALVIFANPSDEAEVFALCRLVKALDSLGQDAPPMFWAPHTAAPEERPPGSWEDLAASGAASQVLEMGLDGVLAGEPEGHMLALAVRSKVHKSAQLSKQLNTIVNERRSNAAYVEYLKECIDTTLWDYLRIRLASNIPPIDPSAARGKLQQLGGFVFGDFLGSGMFGCVYKVDKVGADSTESVVKEIDKAGIRDVDELKRLKRTIDVMQLLSSDKWKHPNVIQLYETYHSPSYIYHRMEYGGPENLYKRLSYRQKPWDMQRPLSCEKTVRILTQAVTAVVHLHTGPRVCHRDIKPENFILSEAPDSLVLKVVDFDLALVQVGKALCRTPCGTLPFTAPEVLLSNGYDAAAADTWSLGVVFLEVLCGVRIIERVLKLQTLQAPQGGALPDAAVPRKIRDVFQAPGAAEALLQEHCLPELAALVPTIGRMLGAMLAVKPAERCAAEHLVGTISQLPAGPAQRGPAEGEGGGEFGGARAPP